jgi:hypothetical protein
METMGWLTMLEVGGQTLLSQMYVLTKVHISGIHNIITVGLGMSAVCARWVPCDFSGE